MVMTESGLPVLSVVIPVYNEGENIVQTLRILEETMPVPHETIIVYDMDDDSTLPVARAYLQDKSGIRLIKNEVARGPSGALRTGFNASRAPWVLVTMADLCDDLTQVAQMLEMGASADVICPSRYCPGGSQELTGLKVWAPCAAGFLLKFFAGLKTYDPTNSFKLYSSNVLKSMVLTSTTSFSVTLEIVAKAHVLGFKIAELPTTWKVRQNGKTNFKFWRSLFVYLPWFCLTLMNGRFFRLPQRWLRALVGTPKGLQRTAS
jgi:glycosyltransferase involved in cell wall biosynthesis